MLFVLPSETLTFLHKSHKSCATNCKAYYEEGKHEKKKKESEWDNHG